MYEPLELDIRIGIIAFMCTVTSCRVGCGCTVWLFTTLGECGLSLSLGLHPIKTHSLTHPHPLLEAGVPATPQKSPVVTSND